MMPLFTSAYSYKTLVAQLALCTASLAHDYAYARPLDSSASASSASSTSNLYSPSYPQPRSFPIYRKRSNTRTGDDLIAWANRHRSNLLNKYDPQHHTRRANHVSKRAAGHSALTNYADDSTWYADVQIGSPAKSYALVLDTGSSDLWVSSDSYTPADSSTFVNRSTAFSVSYGSGDVAGYLATDTFTVAQHTVTGQTFAVGTNIGSGLLDGTTEGIMGLGFRSLSTSGAQPIWQSAGESEFAFYLQEDTDATSTTGGSSGGGGEGNPGIPSGGQRRRQTASNTSPGGVFTLGGANASLYSGDINWLSVTSERYWTVQLGGISVQDYQAGIGSLRYAAIDTGTTLIGGPDRIVANLYAQIPESYALSSAEGYYAYPCDTTINATLTFGNQRYVLSSEDFRVNQVSSGYCMGAIFSVGTVTSSSSIDWIVGDAFLKSVYSIFDASGSTARVGFANLASGLNNSSASETVAQTQTVSSAVSHSLSLTLVVSSAIFAMTILTLFQVAFL